ncbi:hypothetical protein XENTR_v10012205 [Xenopus tropicalis]|nr:hypothetical protein XENTR_v10012205 [Xenopus tropicalis]
MKDFSSFVARSCLKTNMRFYILKQYVHSSDFCTFLIGGCIVPLPQSEKIPSVPFYPNSELLQSGYFRSYNR